MEKVKPVQELLTLVDEVHDDSKIARQLGCDPEYIQSWRPRLREVANGGMIVEAGAEPSTGFTAAALALIRGGKVWDAQSAPIFPDMMTDHSE